MPRHDSDEGGKRAAPGDMGEDGAAAGGSGAPVKRRRTQERGPQKQIFFFKYSGKVPNESLRQKLHAKTFECYVDPLDMYTNAVLYTNKPTRASTLQNTIEIYNSQMLADSAKMILRGQSVADELIITMSREDGMNIRDYGFYKRIIAARDRKDPSYYKWDEATERQIQAAAEAAEVQAAYGAGKESGSAKNFSGNQHAAASSSISSAKLRRLLEIDLVPSSFNPTCPKEQRAASTKNSGTVQLGGSHFPFHTEPEATSACQGAAPSIQTHPTGSLPDSVEGGLNVSLNYRPLGDIEDGYASDPEGPVQPSDILCPLPAQTILQGEDRGESTESLGNASPVSLSPRAKKYFEAVENLIGPLAASVDVLSKESKARDYLASNNERKDSVIADLTHKKKSQEGKTAAQTRKVNLAIQSETKALEESAASQAEAERERKLREKEAAEKSTLLIAHAGLSIAAGNHSTGDKIEDWQSKNGYAHLKEFVSHLRLRLSNLVHDPNHRSLKGVSPALPFSDVAYRRYYEHALGYKDFKEASKSDDKHRLYLGFLSSPVIPQAVLYCDRERKLDQMEELCVALDRPFPFTDCQVGPILPPIESDPFEIDEMKPWKYQPHNIHNNEKMKYLQERFSDTHPRYLWQYLVLLHRCNFKGRLSQEDTKTILTMLQGPMYSEAAFIAMETPLLNKLIALRTELEEKNPASYWELNDRWAAIARQMQRSRDSSHRAVRPDEGRANEYLVFARSGWGGV